MTNIINTIIENWYVIVGALAIIAVAVGSTVKFTKLSKEEKIKQIKKWLFYAVYKAEEEFAGGKGKLKLSYVYDKALDKFPAIADILTYDEFCKLVDEALKEFEAWAYEGPYEDGLEEGEEDGLF